MLASKHLKVINVQWPEVGSQTGIFPYFLRFCRLFWDFFATLLVSMNEVAKTDVKNDLKVIKGIGPKLEETLNKVGLTAYEQLAKMTLKDMTAVLTQAGVNAKMYDLSGWKAQAKLAVKGDMEAVANWTKNNNAQ